MSIEQAISPEALERFERPRNYGPLDQWDGHARLTGPCGDTMEFWLKVADRQIAQASFTTDGSGPSQAAGSMATELATGRLVKEALQIEQKDVLRALGGLPRESEHCALLAVSTLQAAIRDCQQRRQTAQQCGECSKTVCPSKQRGADESEQDFRDRQTLAREMGVPLLGRIPIDPNIVTCGDGGIPYVHRFAESHAARAFAEVVEGVITASQPVPTEPSLTEGENR